MFHASILSSVTFIFQLSSVASNSLWPHGLQHTRPPCPLLKLMSIESVMPSIHLILCHTLLILPSIFPSIRVFSNESVLHIRWPNYWRFSFSINPSNEYSRLISFRIDWFDLLAVQGTLKSLLQHHNSKASILQCWAFFMVQLSHPYMAYKADFSSLAAQAVKNLPAKQKTWVQSLGQEDPMEKGIETHPSILAWETPWAEVPGRLQSMGSQRVRHDWATNTLIFSTSWEARIIW